MKILITGAAGFIGSHLGNRLVALGHQVFGVDDLSHPCKQVRDFPIRTVDFMEAVREEEWDAIYHLAAHINVDESVDRPDLYMENNAMGTLRLLEHLRATKNNTHLIFASSAEVYGSARMAFMAEDHPLDPISPYAVSKLAAEQLCKNYAQLYGMDITVIRNFNTFGEFQNDGLYGGVIAKFKAQALRGEDLTVYGSGEQSRDYMHISQAVAGYVLALNTKLPLIVNFGSGYERKIIDIANIISNVLGVGVIHVEPRPSEVMRLQADISRAKQYGYKPETDFWEKLNNFLKHGA